MATILQTKRLAWALIFLVVTAVALLSYFSGKRYVAAMAAVEHTLAVESTISGTLSILKDVEAGQRGYILTGDLQFLEPYDAARRSLEPTYSKLQRLMQSDTVQRQHVVKLRGLIDDKLAFAAETVQLRHDHDLTQAMALVRSVRGKWLMDQIRDECRAMSDYESKMLARRKTEAAAAERTAMWGVGVGSTLTILLALISLLTVQRDVQELKSAAEDLARSEEYYRLLTEQSSDLVRLLNLQGKTSYVSPSVQHLLGYTVDEYLALSPLSLMHPDELGTAREILEQITNGTSADGLVTYRLRHKSGEFRWFEVRWGVRKDASGKPVDIHTGGRDVTERRQAEAKLSAYAEQLGTYAQQLKTLSLRDELTGLYNRRGFLEVAGQAHALAVRDARPAALVFVDLNGMKRINDELGHDMGDAALVDTADVLQRALRESDVVARLGGDEFVVFALDFTAFDLDGLRRRLRELSDTRVAQANRPFRLSMSVGAAYLLPGSERSLSELLDQADVAMYEQKNARRAAGGMSLPPA